MHYKITVSRAVFMSFAVVLLVLISLVCLAPLWHVLMGSLSNPTQVGITQGLILYPLQNLDTHAYSIILTYQRLWNGYLNTFIYIFLQCVLTGVATIVAGYVFSRNRFRFRNTFMLIISSTMLFNGGTLLYDGWYAFACANTTYTMGQTTNPDLYFQAITNPVLKPGDEPVQCSQRIIAKDPIYITTACEKPELAAQWLDYWWSDEGTYLSWYGIEGETYELDEEGTPEFTELVTNNPDGLAPSDVLYQYAFNSGSWFGKHDVEQGWKMANIINNSEDNIQLDSTAIFSAPETNLWLTSSLAFTDAEGVELTSLQTAVNTLIEEYMVNYINGNDSTSFDDFRETLSSYGMDRIVEIYQAAYDRYLAR